MAAVGRASLAIVIAGVALGCAHQPRKYVAQSQAEDASLPQDPTEQLTVADATAALGPGGPDLSRSLAAADRILAADPAHGEAAWRAARALYLKTYTAQGDAAELAATCMDVSAVATAYSERAEAHYYAALCMGARAKARKIEGLNLVSRMEQAGKRALERDPKIVQAGPHRLLGGIYLWAPAWPASIGDLDLAIEHLETAVELAPDWAENHLLLAFAQLEDDELEDARASLEAAKRRIDLPAAEGWRPFWEERIAELEKRLTQAEEEDD